MVFCIPFQGALPFFWKITVQASIGKTCINTLGHVGGCVLNFLETVGSMVFFFCRIVWQAVRRGFYGSQVMTQLFSMGFSSISLVALTALFTGMVLALQTYTAFEHMNVETALPEIVALSIVRELGPVLTGLMMAGRLGAAMASELATMRVTEQIDALVVLSTNPLQYLVIPRILSAIIILPILTLLSDVIGIAGGYWVSTSHCGFHGEQYLTQTFDALKYADIFSGLVKSAFFGFFLSFISCHEGYYAQNGASGVGKSTTNGVVRSCILILLMNYLLTALFFSK